MSFLKEEWRKIRMKLRVMAWADLFGSWMLFK